MIASLVSQGLAIMVNDLERYIARTDGQITALQELVVTLYGLLAQVRPALVKQAVSALRQNYAHDDVTPNPDLPVMDAPLPGGSH
jgi:hypothetical protein